VPVDHHLVESSAAAGLKVAGQVKEIRRARHLSQRQVAGRMQVPRTYISKIENGKAIPTLNSLERLAAALGVDVRQLVGDARSRRDEEVASILADPLLAEIAASLPRLGPPAHRLAGLPTRAFAPVGGFCPVSKAWRYFH
jgi:transcriptional regulator with XRE-family HTH domain